MTFTLPMQTSGQFRSDVRHLLRLHRRDLTHLLVWHGLAAGAGVVAVTLFGDVVGESARGEWTLAWRLVVGVTACILAQAIFTVASESTAFRLGESLFQRLRDESVTGMLDLPLLMVESATVGELTSRLADDVDDVSEAVKIGIPESLVASVTMIFATCAAFVINWQLAPAFIVGYIWLVASTKWYINRSTSAYDAELVAHANNNGATLSAVRGARTVRQLALVGWLASRISQRGDAVRKAEYHTLTLQRRWFPAAQAAYYLPAALVLGWGGFLCAKGHATLADIVALALYAQMVVNPLDDLLYWTDQFQMASRAFRRSRGFSKPRKTTDEPMTRTPISTQVVLNDATLEYPGGHCGVRGVTARFEGGEWVAVVGPSGAGKSTLGLLIAQLIPPTTGHVDLVQSGEGAPCCYYVSQEGYVFAGSIADNLLLADPTATSDNMRTALEAVEAETWVANMEDGIHTRVGMGGEDLTLAQAQQIALARAWLAQPDVLILDEATAALPLDQATRIERAIRARACEALIVTIAHRLHTAENADRILVIDHGEVVQMGSHAQLSQQPGPYHDLWSIWINGG